MGKSPYLEGNFAPVEREIEAENLVIEGELPRELDGLYLRNGANPRLEPLGRYHWFDGDGMLHAIELRDGRASYRNRWVRTKGFELERKRDRAIWTGVLERPQFDNPDGPTKNCANTSVVMHAGKLLAAELVQVDVILQLGQIGGDQDQALLHRTLLDGQQALNRGLGVGITSQAKDGLGGIGDHPFAVQGGDRLFKFVWHRKNATAGLPPLITGL